MPHNNPSNGDLQHNKSSVPQITIDGGSLINTVKPGLRVNGFFSSQPSSKVLLFVRCPCNKKYTVFVNALNETQHLKCGPKLYSFKSRLSVLSAP